MKKCRFFSLFISSLLFLSLLTPARAADAEPMEINAPIALLVEGGTGEILYEKNKEERHYPASLTKIMTALLTIEALDAGTIREDQVITVTSTALQGLGTEGSNQNIQAGEQLTVRDLLYCSMLASANEACNILAEAVSGSVPAFVKEMNRRAKEIGMKQTNFTNTHGLHEDNHYSSAYDLYLMSYEAMKHPLFREIAAAIDYYVPATNLHEQRHFYNSNALLTNWKYPGYTYRYAIGIKTGSTEKAGQCLASAAAKNDRTLYAIILGAENIRDHSGAVTDRQAFSESKRLLEWGFGHFSRQTILGTLDLQGQLPVTLSKTEQVVAVPNGTLEAMLPKDVDQNKFEITPIYDQPSVEAPITKGQKLGTVSVRYQGKEYGTLDLVALTDVERDPWMYRVHLIQSFFGQIWVRILLALLAVLLLVLFVRSLFSKNRRRYGGSRRGAHRSHPSYRGRRR